MATSSNQLTNSIPISTPLPSALSSSYKDYGMHDAIVPVVNGLIGGFLGAAGAAPFNTIIGRKQKEGGAFRTNIFKILREEGIQGPYKGFTPRGIATAFEKTLKVQVNGGVLYFLQRNHSDAFTDVQSKIMAGASAGIAQAVLITNAMERVSLLMSTYGVGEKNKRLSLIEAVKITTTTGGIFKGLGPCIMRDAPFSAIYFPLYSYLMENVTDKNAFISGGIAGGISAFTVTPADVLKTRMQTTSSKTIVEAFDSVRAQGYRTFFTGAGLRGMRSGFQFAINFWVLDRLNALYKERSSS